MNHRRTVTLAAALLAFGAVAFLTFLFGEGFPLYQTATLPYPRAAAPPPPRVITYDQFGIERDRFETVEAPIARNATFAEILTAHRVPYETVVALAEKARPVFDVRRLRAGASLRIYKDDSLDAARYLVYERDPVHYVVFSLDDSLDVYEGRRPVTIARRVVSGTIDGSLYATLDRQDIDPALATRLSEVYAWQIDFFRIQKGDFFSVVYEEKLVDGRPIEVGEILAARFNHFGRDYYGFRYDDGEVATYYDEKGESLRRAFLKAPLKYERISSRYSLNRFHPVQKRWKAHLGTDYAADTGTPIHTVGDGVVLEAGYGKGNGNYVKIRHNGTYTTGYLHMSRIAQGIRPGARVRQGDVIGYVGSTGLATGPHLCYRFWKNGQQVDPLKEDLPTAEPIAPAHRAAYEQQRDALIGLLDGAAPPQLAANEAAPERTVL